MQRLLGEESVILVALLLVLSTSAHAQHQFRASDGATNDRFGGDTAQVNHLIGISGTNALVGALLDDHAAPLPAGADRGTVYLFRNINTPSGNVTEDARLVASDAGNGHEFGSSAIIEGNTGIVGARFATGGASNTVAGAGAAYLFRNLHLASGTVTQNVKLVASDGKNDDRFGRSVDLNTYNGNQMALVGAHGATTVATIPTSTTLPRTGAAYLYRNLQSVPDGSVITETVKLMGRDNNSTVPHTGTAFGASVALRNNRALVGAFLANWGGSPWEWGKVYLYNNLDTLPAGVAYEDAKLVFPHLDGFNNQHRFGTGVALNETAQLAAVGAYAYDLRGGDSGAVFVYNDLNNIDNVSPDGQNEIFPSAVLGGSDGIAGTVWGYQVELSGNTLLVGSPRVNGNRGAVYLFTNVDQLNSNITTMNQSLGAQGATAFWEQAKVWNTNGAANFQFGAGIDLDGTQFMVSEPFGTGNVAQSGAAYSGDTRTFLGLDDSISLSTNGLSFWSRQNWVIGTNNDNNTITITAGDSANIGKQGGIHDPFVDTAAILNSQTIIGQNAGSDNNTLIVDGTLTAGTTVVGKSGSNNNLIIGSTGTVTLPHPSLAHHFIVGENVGSNDNLVLIQQGGTITATAGIQQVSIGRNGNNNTMIVDGTLNSRLTYVGENGSTNSMVIGSSGTVNITPGQRFVVGQAASSTSNFVSVQTGGVLNAGGTGSILSVGRNGDGNVMVVDGTVNSRVTYIGENAGSDNNLVSISTTGVWNNAANVSIGAAGNTNNELNLNGTMNLSNGSVLNVFDNNILSGAGTIQGTGSTVTISGSLRPGSGTGGSGIGTLTRNDGNVTWNGNASSPWVYELGIAQPTMLLANTGGTRDLLDITSGNFLKGSGSSFVFNFAGTGSAGWYKLVDWTGTTNFSVTDFTAVNINPVVTSYQFFIDNGPGSTTALYIYMIPEPQVWAMLSVVLGALIALRQRLRKAARAQSTPVV